MVLKYLTMPKNLTLKFLSAYNARWKMFKDNPVGKATAQVPRGNTTPEGGSAKLVLGIPPQLHSYQLYSTGSMWCTIRLLNPSEDGNTGV